jgi:hypothetical protein
MFLKNAVSFVLSSAELGMGARRLNLISQLNIPIFMIHLRLMRLCDGEFDNVDVSNLFSRFIHF